MVNKQLSPIKKKKKALIFSACQLLWHKFSLQGLFEAISAAPGDTELGNDVYARGSGKPSELIAVHHWWCPLSPVQRLKHSESGPSSVTTVTPLDRPGWESDSYCSQHGKCPLSEWYIPAGPVQGFQLPLGNPGGPLACPSPQGSSWATRHIPAPVILCHCCHISDHM